MRYEDVFFGCLLVAMIVGVIVSEVRFQREIN